MSAWSTPIISAPATKLPLISMGTWRGCWLGGCRRATVASCNYWKICALNILSLDIYTHVIRRSR
jgi:hypothetical protein